MATRTISNTGGNYNATGTWVEGVVPTSADDVVSTATSGQLTVNVSSAASSINLSTYTNTLTLSNTWTISGSSVTNTFGSGMNFGGTGTIVLGGGAITVTQNTTNRIPNLQFSGATTKTLSTNMYCVNFTMGVGISILNGNNIFISGNLGVPGISTFQTQVSGTSVLYCDGSGYACMNCTSPVTISGSYTTYGQGLFLYTGSTLTITSGATLSISFAVVLTKTASSPDVYVINSSVKLPYLFIVSQACGVATGRPMNITLSQTLIVDSLLSLIQNRFYTSDASTPIVSFYGSGLSASIISSVPSFRTNSSLTAPINSYKAFDLKFNSENTHNIGVLNLIGGFSTDKPLISSITASSTVNINLVSKTASQIINYDFTDVNATGQQIVTINGSLTRTTNVTNVYPSGSGGVSGGSFPFVN